MPCVGIKNLLACFVFYGFHKQMLVINTNNWQDCSVNTYLYLKLGLWNATAWYTL